MAKIIVSSKFIKTPSNKNIGKLLRYIGTREGVEKITAGKDNSKATKRQQDLILKAIETAPESWDYPELKEFFDNPTKANATEFLDAFYERNAEKIDGVKKLMNYYAERPTVEKLGTHGLFSQTDDKIDLDKVAEEVANHNGVVWTHVVSLKREDAERLGYNNAKAWRELVRRNVYELAEAHKIEPSDLRWYGAFHNTTHHPHMHLVVYSKSGKGYLTENGILKLKSAFGNDIFRNEQYKLFKMQTDLRNKLQDEAKEYLNNLVQKSNDYEPSEKAEKLYQKLIEQLKTVKGKNGHNWTKDFFSHYSIIIGYIFHNRGCDLAGIGISFTTEDNLILINQTAKAVKVFFVDDFSVVLVVKRIFTVLQFYLLYHFFYKFVFNRFLTEDIVGRHTGLTAVKIFAKHDALCR